MADKEDPVVCHNGRVTAVSTLLIDYCAYGASLRSLDLLATKYWLRTGFNEHPNFFMFPDTGTRQLTALISQPVLTRNLVNLGHQISVSL